MVARALVAFAAVLLAAVLFVAVLFVAVLFAAVLLAAVLLAAVRFVAALFAAFFAGADPFADFAALADTAFFAAGLVAVRFTGSSVAGFAFVAATYTLSVVRFRSAHVRHRKVSAVSNVGVDRNSGYFAATR